MLKGEDFYGDTVYTFEKGRTTLSITHNHLNNECDEFVTGVDEGCYLIDVTNNDEGSSSIALTDEEMKELFLAYMALKEEIENDQDS